MNRVISTIITRSISRRLVPTKPLYICASKPYSTGKRNSQLINACNRINNNIFSLEKRLRNDLQKNIISKVNRSAGSSHSAALCHRIGRRNYSISVSRSAQDPQLLIALAYRLLENGDAQAGVLFEQLFKDHADDERVVYGYVLSKLNEAQGQLDRLEELVATLTSNNSISTTRGNKNYFPSVLGLIALRRLEFVALTGQEFTAADQHVLDEALKLFEEAVIQWPEHAPLLTILGESYIHCDRLDEGKSMLIKAMKADPTSPMPLGGLAILNMQLGNTTEALKLTKKAIKVGPASVMAWANLAQLHKTLGNHHEEMMCRKKIDELNLRPPIQYGMLLMRDNVDQAISAFNLVLGLEKHKDHPLALDGLASCLYLKGQVDEALSHFEKLDGDQCARTLAEARMTEPALSLLELLHERFPDRKSQLYKSEMLVHAMARDYAQEFAAFKKSLAASNDPCDAAKLQLLNNDLSGALKTVETSVDQKTLHGALITARVMLAAGRVQEAKNLLESYDSDSDEVVELLTRAYLALDSNDDLAQAEAYCLEHQYLSASALALSEIYRRRGDYKQAVESWNKAWTIDNDSIEHIQAPYACPERYLVQQQRAKILEAMGDIDGAVAEYNNVLATNPLDQWSKERLALLQKP